MYNKDKQNRLTLRLTEDQFIFVKMNADSLGVTPSEFLRMVINSAMSIEMKERMVSRLENAKTNFNDQF